MRLGRYVPKTDKAGRPYVVASLLCKLAERDKHVRLVVDFLDGVDNLCYILVPQA